MVEGVKIGLEIHGYLNMQKTGQKLFCRCRIDESQTDAPNTNICARCTGQPGSKPNLPNEEAVQKIIACALMLGCKVNPQLHWQRKHYSYPDSPNNYQRTMSGSYAVPVAQGGTFLGVRITECHLEEDPARYDVKTGSIDYNRCGYPLIEIVTDPDFHTSEEVREWLRLLMRELCTSKVRGLYKNMGIKCDVNVSIKGHPRVEIKNVNSRASIVSAIEHELVRQQALVAKGEAPDFMQTRGWDDAAQSTWFMRRKETATQYMFIPEPDLPAVMADEKYKNQIEASLPLPFEKRKEDAKRRGLSEEQALEIASELELWMLFKELNKKGHDATVTYGIINRLIGESKKTLSDKENRSSHRLDPNTATMGHEGALLVHMEAKVEKVLSLIDTHFDAVVDEFHTLIGAYEQKKIHNQHLKEFLSGFVYELNNGETIKGASPFISNNEFCADAGELDAWVKEAVAENPAQVEQIREGNSKLVHFLVGQVMKKAKGKADPAAAKQKIERAL